MSIFSEPSESSGDEYDLSDPFVNDGPEEPDQSYNLGLRENEEISETRKRKRPDLYTPVEQVCSEPEEEPEEPEPEEPEPEESEDSGEEYQPSEESEESEEVDGEEGEAEAAPAEAPATVEEMLSEGYGKVKEAACAYENDEYQDHTLEMYMKENAALVATLTANAMEEGYGEVKETELTQEMYEAACNELKESYCKKIDELKETYGAGKE